MVLGCKVLGLVFEVLGLGYVVLGLGYEVLGLGYEVLELGYEDLGQKAGEYEANPNTGIRDSPETL